MKLIIPAYFVPGHYFWSWLLQSEYDQISDVVINPDSGPGHLLIHGYKKVSAACKRRSIGVLGYVATGYGKKEFKQVVKEIDRFFEWYHVDGIFLDEASSDGAYVNYYLRLRDVIEGKVVANHGTVPDSSYLTASDVQVVFEGSLKEHQAFQPPAAWRTARIFEGSPEKRCEIIFGCGVADMPGVLARVSERSGFVYITGDILPNPYDTLPPYLNELLRLCSETKTEQKL